MAKLRGPLLSFRARGQIGKALVVSSWRGINYARQYVEPAYTNTLEQQETRAIFSWLNAQFARMGSIQLLPWTLATIGRPRTARNQLIATNLALLKAGGDMENYLASPGARGGPAPDSFTAVSGGASGEIDAEIVPPLPPTGWLVASASFCAFLNGEPREPYQGQPVEASVASPGPYEYTFTGLNPGGEYYVGAWVVYTRPDGNEAVSIGVSSLATALA